MKLNIPQVLGYFFLNYPYLIILLITTPLIISLVFSIYLLMLPQVKANPNTTIPKINPKIKIYFNNQVKTIENQKLELKKYLYNNEIINANFKQNNQYNWDINFNFKDLIQARLYNILKICSFCKINELELNNLNNKNIKLSLSLNTQINNLKPTEINLNNLDLSKFILIALPNPKKPKSKILQQTNPKTNIETLIHPNFNITNPLILKIYYFYTTKLNINQVLNCLLKNSFATIDFNKCNLKATHLKTIITNNSLNNQYVIIPNSNYVLKFLSYYFNNHKLHLDTQINYLNYDTSKTNEKLFFTLDITKSKANVFILDKNEILQGVYFKLY